MHPAAAAERQGVDLAVEGGEGVDGALALAGEVAEDVDHRLQVLVHDRLRRRLAAHRHQLGERHLPGRRVEPQRQTLAQRPALGGGEPRQHRHRLAGGGNVEAGELPAAAGARQRLHHRRDRDSAGAGLSRSGSTTSRGCAAASESSTSTTPGWCSKARRTCRASASRAAASGP